MGEREREKKNNATMERSVGTGRVPSLKDTGVANSSLERLAVKWACVKGGGTEDHCFSYY